MRTIPESFSSNPIVKSYLDDIDRQILGLLQSDGRMTNAELAKRVTLSPPSALQRVRGLERAGYIRRYTAVLDPDKLGMKVTVWAMVSLSLLQDQPIENFRKSVSEIDEIVECYHVSGEFDFLLKILVTDIRSYEQLIRDKLSRLKGIQQLRSSFVLAAPKQSTQLPL